MPTGNGPALPGNLYATGSVLYDDKW